MASALRSGEIDFGIAQPQMSSQANGLWRATLTLPQGLPPGTYGVAIALWDAGHLRTYVSPGALAGAADLVLGAAELGEGTGFVTVVDNS